MIIGWRRLGAIWVVAAGLVAVACDSGAPSKSRDDIAADSALASDLALANRDTLLVDSIGAYTPPGEAEGDTAVARDSITVSSPAQPIASARPATPPTGKKTEVPKPAVTVPPPKQAEVVAPAPAPAAAPTRTPTVASGPTRKGTAACSSPLKADQEECLRTILPAAD